MELIVITTVILATMVTITYCFMPREQAHTIRNEMAKIRERHRPRVLIEHLIKNCYIIYSIQAKQIPFKITNKTRKSHPT